MKICLACHAEFEKSNWICPSCEWSPAFIEGFPAFAPAMALDNDGLNSAAHHRLEKLQRGSFWFRVRNRLIQDAIKRHFPDANEILEIGCGSGFVLNGIRSVLPTARLTATEIYSNGLFYAAQKVSEPCEFLQVDARQLPFKTQFDVVGAFDVLEHIEEDELVLNNIKSSLKPDGGVILTAPQHMWLWSKVDEDACHKRRYKRKQLSQLLLDNGFEILLDTSFMFFLLPLMLMQRLIGSTKRTYDPATELALPQTVDKVFEKLLECERQLIRFGVRFPIGGSRLVVARLNKI